MKLWKELTPMTTPRAGCKARVIDDEIFVVGGFNGNYLSDTESYNPVADIWKRRTSMNEKRYAPGVFFFQNNNFSLRIKKNSSVTQLFFCFINFLGGFC